MNVGQATEQDCTLNNYLDVSYTTLLICELPPSPPSRRHRKRVRRRQFSIIVRYREFRCRLLLSDDQSRLNVTSNQNLGVIFFSFAACSVQIFPYFSLQTLKRYSLTCMGQSAKFIRYRPTRSTRTYNTHIQSGDIQTHRVKVYKVHISSNEHGSCRQHAPNGLPIRP